MDRTGKFILFGSVALLIASFIFQPKTDSQQSERHSDKNDGNTSDPKISSPPETGKPTNNVPPRKTNPPPSPKTDKRKSDSEEASESPKTAMLQNNFVRYTFTARGGGIESVEMVEKDSQGNYKYPKEIGKKISAVGLVKMDLDRGRLPLLALEPSIGKIEHAPEAVRPYNAEPSIYEMSRTANGVMLHASFGQWSVKKVFTLGEGYQLKAEVTVTNDSNSTSKPVDFYLVSGTAHEPISKSRMMGMGYGTMWFNGDEEESIGPGWFDNKPLGCACIPGGNPRNNFRGTENVKWVGAYSRFFIQAVIPFEPSKSVNIHRFSLDALSDSQALKMGVNITDIQKAYETALLMEVPSLPERGSKIYNYTLYTGPREYDRLARIGKERENRFELIMDFGGWFGWVAEGLLRVMKWFHGKGLSYAMAIIAITFIIKLIFWPITARSTRAMKKMAAVNAKMMPEIKDIRERYKDNYQKMNMKMMEIYKKYGVNPLSQMGGCLPMLIQLPIFFGFFTMLRTAIELRGAEFLWVADLSSPDTVTHIAGFPINIMPLLMTGTMFLQMRLQPPSPGMDPTQQAMMKYMPLMFVFFFYSASSGLCLYWTASNILGIVQTKMTKIEPVENNAVEVIPPTKKKRKT
ncbi:MAG: membrane protein insertase YidC [Verrucomicrobiota bacterium]|jgi:YidC/Oxa1 family membrane protein insertase|nr:membrane protein insertase YidC [Verrucomicrobiota bacterium]